MKSIKEKAERYDEVLSMAKEWYNNPNSSSIGKSYLYAVFPELKESEDESIKEWLINLVKGHIEWLEDRIREQLSNGQVYGDELVKAKNSLAWLEKQDKKIDAIENFDTEFEKQISRLIASIINKDYKYTKDFVKWTSNALLNYAKYEIEKQGEQKPADYENPNIQQNDFAPKSAMEAIKEEKVDNANKVEQKFKEGDWVVYQNQTFQVTKNSGNNLILQGRRYQTYFIEELCKPWTIDDAKDGDVLHSPCCKLLWVYKDEKTCYVGSNLNYNSGSIVINKPICIPTDVQPATKEQRDTLKKAIHEAGYMWDTEGKQLVSLKAEPIDEQKPVEWSEEDKTMVEDIIEAIDTQYAVTDYNEMVNWLKSLKDRYTWTPSEEQMDALNLAIGEANSVDTAAGDEAAEILTSLYEQLKKLREG